MQIDVTELARAMNRVAQIMMDLTEGNQYAASALLFGEATEWRLSLGRTPTDLYDQIFLIDKDRNTEALGEGSKP
jgi:hypothetical protein